MNGLNPRRPVSQPHDVPFKFRSDLFWFPAFEEFPQNAVMFDYMEAIIVVEKFLLENDEHVAREGFPERSDDLVVGGEADLTMKLEIGMADPEEVAATEAIRHLFKDQIELSKKCGKSLASLTGISNGNLLERAANFVESERSSCRQTVRREPRDAAG